MVLKEEEIRRARKYNGKNDLLRKCQSFRCSSDRRKEKEKICKWKKKFFVAKKERNTDESGRGLEKKQKDCFKN